MDDDKEKLKELMAALNDAFTLAEMEEEEGEGKLFKCTVFNASLE